MRFGMAIFVFFILSPVCLGETERDKAKVIYLAGEISQLYFFGALIESGKNSCASYKDNAKVWARDYKAFTESWVKENMHDLFVRALDAQKQNIESGVDEMTVNNEHVKVPGVEGGKNNCLASLYFYLAIYEKIKDGIAMVSEI